VDIKQQYSKTTDELGDAEFDYVITVCGHADENCPFFPAKTQVIHHVLMIRLNLQNMLPMMTRPCFTTGGSGMK